MTDLDKKIQKNQQDLVQSVLEAFEKRNVERCDILITNALKQLKGSRFKPDTSICIGLIYLARVQPKVFSQSNNLKEFLKTHIKRDGVPANIKGNKTDFFLPVLAANILMASCDSPDVRTAILTRIGQWISSNQKLNELVQHVLAMLCVRCQGDQMIIKTLIEMRHQWFEFLETNFDIYGPVSSDLARSIRNLLGVTATCESFVENLTFLMKHDPDVVGLCSAISRFIVQKPLTFNSIMSRGGNTDKLLSIVLSIFETYFQQHTSDLKSTVKKDEDGQLIIFNLQPNVLALDEIVLQALLLLIATDQPEKTSECPHLKAFLSKWLSEAKSKPNSSKVTFIDVTLATPYHISSELLSRMIGTRGIARELALYNATPDQLVELALMFGLSLDTLNHLFERLKGVAPEDSFKSDLRDIIYFNEMMDYYADLGVKNVDELRDRLNEVDLPDQDSKTAQQPVDIKIKKEIT